MGALSKTSEKKNQFFLNTIRITTCSKKGASHYTDSFLSLISIFSHSFLVSRYSIYAHYYAHKICRQIGKLKGERGARGVIGSRGRVPEYHTTSHCMTLDIPHRLKDFSLPICKPAQTQEKCFKPITYSH